SSLRKRIDSTKDHDPIVERRLLGGLLAFCSETADPLMDRGQYDLALDLYTAIADFAKSAPRAYLGKARAPAKLGKQKEALAAARKAVDAGLPKETVRTAPELANLLQKPEWQALLTPAN